MNGQKIVISKFCLKKSKIFIESNLISANIYSDVTLGIEMLLEAGADPKIKDSNKKTALDHAVAKSEKSCGINNIK